MDTRRMLDSLSHSQQLLQTSVQIMRSAKATIHMARHAMARQGYAYRTRDLTKFFYTPSAEPPSPLTADAAEQQWDI